MGNLLSMESRKVRRLNRMAATLRLHTLQTTSVCGGHPTTCSSIAEIVAVLFFHTMRYNVHDLSDAANDRFVMSKGHGGPIMYAACAEAGAFPIDHLMTMRQVDSDLEGHPTTRLRGVDVGTGSLGIGLCVAIGMAYTAKYFDKTKCRVYCIVGDGESAEGSVWEGFNFASYYKLDNLVVIIDINRLGQNQETQLGYDMKSWKKRVDSFGLNGIIIDGHNVNALRDAFGEAKMVKGKPTCLLAKTVKGKCIPGVENEPNWHGKPLGEEKIQKAMASIRKSVKLKPTRLKPRQPLDRPADVNLSNLMLSRPPEYLLGDMVEIREAYGTGLAKLGQANHCVIALDGDCRKATRSETFREACPDRFIECFIAEQNMVGVAIGCAARNRTVPFVSTNGAFMARCHDQIRIAAMSGYSINYCGNRAGVAIDEEGPCVMGLDDITLFRGITNSTVFYPSDGVSMERAVELAANTQGTCYIRSTNPPTPIIYSNLTQFTVGKAHVIMESPIDAVTVIAAGMTLVEAIKAADTLSDLGINIRIIDPFTIKPIDADTIGNAARATGGRVVTVEDHYAEGGLGEAVMVSLHHCRDVIVKCLAVEGIPRTGSAEELLDLYGIGASSIVEAVKDIISLRPDDVITNIN